MQISKNLYYMSNIKTLIIFAHNIVVTYYFVNFFFLKFLVQLEEHVIF